MKIKDLTEDEVRLVCGMVNHAGEMSTIYCCPESLSYFKKSFVLRVLKRDRDNIRDEWAPVLNSAIEKIKRQRED